MAPVTEHKPRRAVRFNRKRELETASGVWPWTVGDESDGDEDVRTSLRLKRRVRRQEPRPPNPNAPFEGGFRPPSTPSNAIDESPSASESDGISSNSSGGEEEPERFEEEPAQPGIERPSRPVGRPEEQPSSTVSQVSDAYCTY